MAQDGRNWPRECEAVDQQAPQPSPRGLRTTRVFAAITKWIVLVRQHLRPTRVLAHISDVAFLQKEATEDTVQDSAVCLL